MIFTDIRLQNYRSYADSSFELGQGVNIVVGPNGAGKTNLLEAIMVTAIGKSYRARDYLLVKDDSDWARIDVHTNNNSTRVVKLQQTGDQKTEKTFTFDDRLYKKLTPDHKHPVVLFEPDNLFLLHAQPGQRRDYLDDLLEQLVPGYSRTRLDLRRVVAQRNALLKQPEIGTSQLFAWNLRLAEIATKVVTSRLSVIEEINKSISATCSEISNKQMPTEIRYETKTNTENYTSDLMKQLEQNYQLDRLRGFTGRGPHRDDFSVFYGEGDMSNMASRGENRTFILALKIIELRMLEAKTGKRPLLLLDDVFSELDGTRRRALVNFLNGYQTVITTTDADIIVKQFMNKSSNVILLN